MMVPGAGAQSLERPEELVVALYFELGEIGGPKEGTVEHRDRLQRWREGS